MASMKVSRLTYADLQQLPQEDGKRYELIDGELIVSPSPALLHQRAVRRLSRLIEDACPTGMELLFAPFDWLVDDHNVYEPDVLVGRDEDFTDRYLAAPPVLAVEVLSPSNRGYDLVRKRAAYERAGLPHYWIVDPEVPWLMALAHRKGRFVEVAKVADGDTATLAEPFEVTVCPADLVSAPSRRET